MLETSMNSLLPPFECVGLCVQNMTTICRFKMHASYAPLFVVFV